MTHQNLLLSEKAIKAHSKRLQKELKNLNQDLPLTQVQNLLAKTFGFNNFHELKNILVINNKEMTAEEIEKLSQNLYKKDYKKHYEINFYKLKKEEKEELQDIYINLFDFVTNGDLENIKKLLFKNPDLNLNFLVSKRSWQPKSLIEFALSFEHIEIVDYLINNFKSINLHISDDYLMRHACISGNLKLIKKLLELTNYNYSTLNNSFILACHYGHLEVIKYLLKVEGVDIHFLGDSSLKDACKFGHLEIVKYLLTSNDLKEHANIFSPDNWGFKTGKDIRDMFIWELESKPEQRHWDKDRSKLFKILDYILNNFDPQVRNWFQEKQELKRYI